MILRNWYNAFKAGRSKGMITNGLTTPNGSKANAGSYHYQNIVETLLLYKTTVAYSTSSYGIVLGSGTTPATLDDYKMESMIKSGLSCSVAVAVDDDNDAIYKVTITNTSNAEITIGEIGMQHMFYTQANNSSGTTLCLSERTVLDNPITIPAGGIGLIDYAIKLPIPEV